MLSELQVVSKFGQDTWIMVLCDRLWVLVFLPDFDFKELPNQN